MNIGEEPLEFNMELEQSANDELDEILSMGLKQEDRGRRILVVEGAELDLSMEEWEEEVNNMDFEEWLVQEMMEMYSPCAHLLS